MTRTVPYSPEKQRLAMEERTRKYLGKWWLRVGGVIDDTPGRLEDGFDWSPPPKTPQPHYRRKK